MMSAKPKELVSSYRLVIKDVMMKKSEVFTVAIRKAVDGTTVRGLSLFRAITAPGMWFQCLVTRRFGFLRIEVVIASFRRMLRALHSEARLVG